VFSEAANFWRKFAVRIVSWLTNGRKPTFKKSAHHRCGIGMHDKTRIYVNIQLISRIQKTQMKVQNNHHYPGFNLQIAS
jgi:hypothetical protein